MAESGALEESCCAVFAGEAGEPTALASGTAESGDEDVAPAESGRAAPELVHGLDAGDSAAEPDVVAAGSVLVGVVSAASSPQPANAMAANDKIATHLYIWPLLCFGTSASFVQLSFRARQLAIQSAVAVLKVRTGEAAAGREARAKAVDTAHDDREGKYYTRPGWRCFTGARRQRQRQALNKRLFGYSSSTQPRQRGSH